MRPDLRATLHQQLADLFCLPGGYGATPVAPSDCTRNGHHWYNEPSWRRYRCAICAITSRNPDAVTLSCEQVRIDAEKHRRKSASQRQRTQELLRSMHMSTTHG